MHTKSMLQLHMQSLNLQCPTCTDQKEMQLLENKLFDLGLKVTQKVSHFHLQHVICVPTKFEVATFNGLEGDAFAT